MVPLRTATTVLSIRNAAVSCQFDDSILAIGSGSAQRRERLPAERRNGADVQQKAVELEATQRCKCVPYALKVAAAPSINGGVWPNNLHGRAARRIGIFDARVIALRSVNETDGVVKK